MGRFLFVRVFRAFCHAFQILPNSCFFRPIYTHWLVYFVDHSKICSPFTAPPFSFPLHSMGLFLTHRRWSRRNYTHCLVFPPLLRDVVYKYFKCLSYSALPLPGIQLYKKLSYLADTSCIIIKSLSLVFTSYTIIWTITHYHSTFRIPTTSFW